MSGRVVAVGLGPAGADLIVPAARAAIDRVTPRFARTARHPAIEDLARDGIVFECFDALYEAGEDLDEVYRAITAALVAAASDHGEVCYAVPGNPAVAERTIALLRAEDVDLELIPGLSFTDLVWLRVGVDALGGGRVVDAHGFAIEAAGHSGPLLVAQCDRRAVLSDVKLVLLEGLLPEHPVVVLQRLGRPDEAVFPVALAELDRSFEPDHLTCLFVDTGDVAVAAEFARLVALTERLRGPGGCPWDAAQSHHSLRRHLLEEAHEVAEAIERLPHGAPAGGAGGGGEVQVGAYEALADELGDLLFQVVIHAVLAAEAGEFTIADVSRGIHDKLVRRHPHVFGDVTVASADEVVVNWEQIKQREQGHTSLVEGISAGLPALLYCTKLFRKAAAVGLDPADDEQRASGLIAAARRLVDAGGGDPAAFEELLGDLLAAAVASGRAAGVDAEAALAGWSRRFKDHFARFEALAAERGVDLAGPEGAVPEVVRALWQVAGES